MNTTDSAAGLKMESDRTHPLTAAEMRASLHAIHRLLVHARMMGYQGVDPRRIADFLDWVEFLPEMLLNPPHYDVMFRGALEYLANLEPFCRGILQEYDDALKADARSPS